MLGAFERGQVFTYDGHPSRNERGLNGTGSIGRVILLLISISGVGFGPGVTAVDRKVAATGWGLAGRSTFTRRQDLMTISWPVGAGQRHRSFAMVVSRVWVGDHLGLHHEESPLLGNGEGGVMGLQSWINSVLKSRVQSNVSLRGVTR